MLRFEDYKLKTEQAFALLNTVSPYDIFARVELMCSLKILSYQLGEFQCHIRDTDEHKKARSEILEMYPSHIVYPSQDQIRHSLCKCADLALLPDPSIIAARIEQQAQRLKDARPIDADTIAQRMIDTEVDIEPRTTIDVIDEETKPVVETLKEPPVHIDEAENDPVIIRENVTTLENVQNERHSVVSKETYMDALECNSDKELLDEKSPPQAALISEKLNFLREKVLKYEDELSVQIKINKRMHEVCHYYKYERGLNKTKIRYDMYRLDNIVIRYDNKGKVKHIVQRRRDNSDNIYYEISDPNRIIDSSDFEPWLGTSYPSEKEEFDYAAIITKIRYDIGSLRSKRLFNHRLKFLNMKQLSTEK